MAIYSWAGRTTTFTTTTAACFEVRTSASNRITVLELGFNNATTATAQTIGVGISGAIGLTPAGGGTPIAEDFGAPASTVLTALSWATSPTVPGTFFRRANFSGTIGVGIVWQFPRGIIIPVSSSLVIWNITTTVAADVWVVFDEQGS